MTLERFPLGLNRDSQAVRKGGVLVGDSASGMRHDRAFKAFLRKCAERTEVALLGTQHDRNPL